MMEEIKPVVMAKIGTHLRSGLMVRLAEFRDWQADEIGKNELIKYPCEKYFVLVNDGRDSAQVTVFPPRGSGVKSKDSFKRPAHKAGDVVLLVLRDWQAASKYGIRGTAEAVHAL